MKNATPPISSDNAWIKTFESPIALKREALSKSSLSLNGLTFAAKDNIDVAGFPTTAACPDFQFTPTAHATVITKLLNAGATLVGKTNLDQFACGLNGTRSPYGPVPNAINPAYVSGGSSSGSAFVVATGQVDFSLGTDTAGSGRVPAGLNNIVGFKPSRGLISTHGVLPAARSVDCVSIFSRDVPTAWRVFQAARGHDIMDPYSRQLPLKRTPFPSNLIVGIPNQCAVADIQAMGATVKLIDYTPLLKIANLLYGSALIAERLEVLAEFIKTNPVAINEAVYRIITQGEKYTAVDVYRAITELKILGQQSNLMWQDIHVLMVPTAPTHYTIEAMLDDPIELNRRLGHYTNFVNLLDYAAISVPSSIRQDGLPFGITLIAPAGSDWSLIDLGHRYHQQTMLQLGATEQTLNPTQTLSPIVDTRPCVQVAVVGAHLSGMPLNWQLQDCGARLISGTKTSNSYRLYSLSNSLPAKPGLLRVETGKGESIDIEIWQMPIEAYGGFVASIPSPLGIGQIEIIDGTMVQGFVCEPEGLKDATDITSFKGWKKYLASMHA
jgi:allophanate hydrolase